MKKRSVSIRGHDTSLSLEDAFWDELIRISASHNTSVASVVVEIDRTRKGGLSSAVRLYILEALKLEAAACRIVSEVPD